MRLNNRSRSRAGVTLIELLIVVTIIILMVGVFTGAAQRLRTSQRVRVSSDTLVKLQTGLDNQREAFIKAVKKERKDNTPTYKDMVTFCDNDQDRAEALLLYCRMRQHFPQTVTELNTPQFTLTGNGVSIRFDRPRVFNSVIGINGTPEEVSAALLFVALSQREYGGLGFASDEATSGSQRDHSLSSAGAAKVYSDGFTNPIGFRRFAKHPSGEMDQAPFTNAKDAGRKDPFDPLGKLATWGNAANRNQARNVIFATTTAGTGDATDFDGTNRMPTVYSAGLNEAFEAMGGDDIVGYRLLKLGERGTK